MKPICVPCQRFFRPKQNGFYFLEGMPADYATFDEIVGQRDPSKWKAYKLWSGDLWECPDCKAQIISGVGFRPMSSQHDPNFEKMIEELNADQFQVNDC